MLIGPAVQISGLLLLSLTFYQLGLRTTTLALVPATALIGYGQALIVNSFYRIGMRDIRACDAGAGSAILSTLQQATLGLGPAILGSLFLTPAQRGGGDYTQALIVFLLVEVAMMLLLGAIAPLAAPSPEPAAGGDGVLIHNCVTSDLHNSHPAVIITAGCTGDVMQELISQIAALGIKNHPYHLAHHYFLALFFSDGDCRSSHSAQSGSTHL